MRARVLAAALAAFAAAPAAAADVDVVIQAGHQGRPASCAALRVAACNLGASSRFGLERDWTPIVADAAAARVRAAGLRVVRRPADYREHDVARAAVFLHFDGAEPCASGASVGFPEPEAPAFVRAWETRYRATFPFRFVGENISTNESHYYGFRKVDAPHRMLIEFGELTCPVQAAWLHPRLAALGTMLGDFLVAELR